MPTPENSQSKKIIPEVPYHLFCRGVGALNIGIAGFIGKYGVETFLNSDLSEPIKTSAVVGVGILSMVGIIDGAGDIYKGVHHYLGLRTWQKLTGNQSTKDRIERRIQIMLSIRNQKSPLF